jgi:hypothetical protein
MTGELFEREGVSGRLLREELTTSSWTLLFVTVAVSANSSAEAIGISASGDDAPWLELTFSGLLDM